MFAPLMSSHKHFPIRKSQPNESLKGMLVYQQQRPFIKKKTLIVQSYGNEILTDLVIHQYNATIAFAEIYPAELLPMWPSEQLPVLSKGLPE